MTSGDKFLLLTDCSPTWSGGRSLPWGQSSPAWAPPAWCRLVSGWPQWWEARGVHAHLGFHSGLWGGEC